MAPVTGGGGAHPTSCRFTRRFHRLAGMTSAPPESAAPRRPRVHIVSLRRTGASETAVQRVAGVLAEAFSTDPFTTALLPDGRHVDRLTGKFTGMIRDLLGPDDDGRDKGAVDVALDPQDGSVLGVALWDRPGHSEPNWKDRLGTVQSYVRTHGLKAWDALRTTAACDKVRPSDPHWYLMELGTAPAARGRGVGSSLVSYRLRHARRDGVGVYLESSTRDNVPFYEKLGFEEVGMIETKGTNDLTAMWQQEG